MPRAVIPPPELHALAEAELARLSSGWPLDRLARLEWRRYRTTAGTACLATGTIALGLHVATDAERVRATLVHEYAHLLAAQRAGREGRGHGPAWREAMRELGAEPERTHHFSVRRNRPRRVVVYRCQTCGAEIPRRRRLPRGRAYEHAGCVGRVRLSAVRPAPPDPSSAPSTPPIEA